ncbi:MAG TPA: ATP-binding protein, partial [Steroidobacteraceae bacterium]
FFACAAVMFVEPARSARARGALLHALGARNFEYFCGCLAFIRTAHYWTMLHPEIESEEDMLSLLGAHEDLAKLLLEDPEADRCEMGERLYEELSALRELHERQELERAKQALEEKDRQKDQFIAVLAHELRNPLAAIRSAADAMKLVGSADERSVRLLQRLDRQSTAMARMLDDLLDASRIALGKVEVELKTLDLVNLLQEVLEEQQSRVREAGLMLEVSIEEKPPSCVKADQVRLRQIIDNLLSNAIKFTPAGGAIRVRLQREGSLACITVRDTGVGFDEQFASELFEPFTQEEHGPGRPGGGLGLGLAIASRLARLQGGSLRGESDGPSQGAIFTLRIPLAPELNEGHTAVRTASQRQRGGGQVLLLVEDNVDVADNFAELLELSGFQVQVVHTGADAMRAALDCIPDVILCDLGLPGDMDGFAVASACRANDTLRSVRLIAASGYSSREHQAAAKAAGFELLLTKPLTSASLGLLAGERRDQ